ncbi:MAG: hypothetical protein HY880_05655 [Deltaproteobacteria bacterium]|nr:hypothetical protein [Deltaproteobacteria bacterium]
MMENEDLGAVRISGGQESAARVTFSNDQQAKVQELIDDAYRRAFTKASKELGRSNDVEGLREEVSKLKEERKTAMLLKAISRYSVVDAEEVAELIKPRVKLDEGGAPFVSTDAGAVMTDDVGRPMPVDEYVARWLGERPHHLRSSSGGGAGSLGSRFSEGRARYDLAEPSSWRQMPHEEFERLLGEGVDIHGTSGQVFRFRNVKNPFVEAKKRMSK